MANRRCFRTLSRYLQSINLNLQSINLNPISQSITHSSTNALYQPPFLRAIHHIFNKNNKFRSHSTVCTRHFSSKYSDGDDDDEEDEESEGEDDADNENESIALSPEDKVKDAAEIGYSVIGPLQLSDRVFKPYEPVFAVIQIGSHQFKVSNRDTIYVERLKYCDVNDKVILNKVLMLGSESQTIIGRPVLPDAAVHAVVEEHALDAKVIIFKKKRRKNYRRTKGHRQELTKLRITDILGIEKPEKTTSSKTEKKEKPTPLKTEKKEKPVKLAVGA